MINNKETPTGRSAGSLGRAGFANSFLWIDPEKGLGGAHLTQVLPFIDGKSFPLYIAFESAAYDALA